MTVTINPSATTTATSTTIPRKKTVVATRGNYNYTGDGSGGQTRFESYIKAAICKGGCSELQIVFCNTYSIDEGESVSLLSSATLESSVTYNGTLYTVTFQGKKSPVVDPSSTLVYSDPIGIDLPEGAIIEIRTGLIIAVGGRVPVGLRSGGSATVKVRSIAATSQVYTTAAMVTPSGGVAASNGYVPLMVLGYTPSTTKSVALWGDSILVGIGATSKFTTGLFGWAENGCANAGIGFTNLARGGDKTGAYSAATCTTRFASLRNVDYVIANMSVNDILGGRTASQILANIDTFISRCNNIGVKVIYTKCITSTTSTDNWATLANQTPTTGFAVGSVRDQVNTGLEQRFAQGKIFGLLDPSSVVLDQATNKWLPNMTDDGVHPNDAGHDAMAAYLTNYLNSI